MLVLPHEAGEPEGACGVSRGIVLSLCDETCVMVKPWADAGYLCYTVDLLHPAGEMREGNIIRVGADVLRYLPPRADYVAAFAFPACTNLAVSGARWFKDKGLAGLIEGLELVERCRELLEWTDAPYMLENPVSTISTYWRKPDCMFDPCDFGGYEGGEHDAYTKRTCLWTGNGFAMPLPRRIEPAKGSMMHLLPPSDDRARLRSKTPAGFARAVFEANCPAAEIKEAAA